jgi:hypothetical protein
MGAHPKQPCRTVVRGIPVASESWKLGPYMDHWPEIVVKPTSRAAAAIGPGQLRLCGLMPSMCQ